jgi:hypothetical protein
MTLKALYGTLKHLSRRGKDIQINTAEGARTDK